MTVSSGISLIMPVYNGQAYLEQALQSVFAQNRRPDEVILVDDGSTDGTADIVRSHAEVTYLHQTNRGLSATLNRGIRSATGDLFAFLDQDDLWPVDMLEGHCALLQQHPEAQIVVGLVQPFRMESPGPDKPKMDRIGEPVRLLNLGSALFRRSVFDRIGLMDEELRFGMDWDWFLRAREEGVVILTRPETALFYRRHRGNMTNQTEQLDQQLLVMIRKSLERRRQHGPAGDLPRPPDFVAAVKRQGSLSDGTSE